MKTLKLLLFSFFTITLVACSYYKDSAQETQNTIIGTWKLFKSYENNIQISLNSCDMEESMIFRKNGDFLALYYNYLNRTCVLNNKITGVWENTVNIYDITIDGEIESKEFFFEDYNTFSYVYTETSSGG